MPQAPLRRYGDFGLALYSESILYDGTSRWSAASYTVTVASASNVGHWPFLLSLAGPPLSTCMTETANVTRRTFPSCVVRSMTVKQRVIPTATPTLTVSLYSLQVPCCWQFPSRSDAAQCSGRVLYWHLTASACPSLMKSRVIPAEHTKGVDVGERGRTNKAAVSCR